MWNIVLAWTTKYSIFQVKLEIIDFLDFYPTSLYLVYYYKHNDKSTIFLYNNDEFMIVVLVNCPTNLTFLFSGSHFPTNISYACRQTRCDQALEEKGNVFIFIEYIVRKAEMILLTWGLIVSSQAKQGYSLIKAIPIFLYSTPCVNWG